MEDLGQLPKEVLGLLEAENISTEEFLYSVTGDMDEAGEYTTVWLAFDKKGIYIAMGTEELVKIKKKKALTAKYTLDKLECIPFEDFDKLKTEKYVSTGRLIGIKDGEESPVIKFSLGLTPNFEDFVKAFNTVKEGGKLEEVKKTFHESPFCPTCGMRYPDPKRKICPKCIDKKSTIKRLFEGFSGHGGKIAIIIGTMLFGTLLGVLMPQVSTRLLYDTVLNTDNTKPVEMLITSLGYIVLAILGVRLLNLLFSIVYQYILSGIMPWVIYDIKLKIFKAMQRLGVSFYTSKQTGSLMERVTSDSNNIYWFFVDGLPYIIVNVITMVAVITIMAFMSWKLTLITVATVPVIVIVFRVLDKMWHRLHHKRWAYNANLTSMVSDNINGARVIKAFSREEEENRRFSVMSGKVMGAEIKLSNTEITAYPLIFLFIYIVTTAILAVGGIMVVNGEMSLGTLLTFVIYLNMIHGPLDFLSWVSNWWARCLDSAQRVFEIIDSEPDVAESKNPTVLEHFEGGIEISELEFEYEPARPVIKKLDLKVNPGEMLGIVGKTGAGKTTIANLIARLYDAKAGVIKIDGVDVKDLKLSQLRENIGLVSQDIYLFMGTIADNIRYSNPDAPIEEVIAAAKAASAHDFIMKLPDTYETRIGAGGQDLSGGERQRVSIARTIIQNPKILILDEATAAMDTETERNIQNALSELKEGRTTLAIAHRLSTLRDADMLAVIDDGKVVETGTYKELMLKKGEYYKLYQIQAEALKYVGIGDE